PGKSRRRLRAHAVLRTAVDPEGIRVKGGDGGNGRRGQDLLRRAWRTVQRDGLATRRRQAPWKTAAAHPRGGGRHGGADPPGADDDRKHLPRLFLGAVVRR